MSQWQKTPVSNLVRNAASGTYYARVRIRGKLIWKSLKTDIMSVGKLRLGDFIKEENHRAEATQANVRGKMTFSDALTIYQQQLQNAQHLKPAAKIYREKCIKALLKRWPELEGTDVRRITVGDCQEWASRFARDYSSSVFNNTVGTLRHVLKIAIQSGARYGNPADEIKKMKVRQKILKLPEHNQFLSLVMKVRAGGGRFSQDCGDLVEFLAYSGARKSEAARIVGSDCDLLNGRISIKGDPETGTKNWEVRTIPMIPDMRRLLERIKTKRDEKEFLSRPITHVHECQKAIDSACKKLNISRFTHHDLRHLFATRCIESGVDIPTVSRWLGHKDGGALAMKTYGHLRDQHSVDMAQKVTFANHPENVIPMPDSAPEGRSASQPSDADERCAIAKAKAKYAYAWWVSANPQEIFWGQLHEEVSLISTDKILEAATQAMGREVFSQELKDRQSLRDEFRERIPKAAIVELTSKIRRRDTERKLKAS